MLWHTWSSLCLVLIATSTSSVLPSKYKLAECVGKRCVELSIIRQPRWSLPSVESTSHPVPPPFFFIVNRSLFTNGMSPLLSYSSFVPRKALIWHTARQEGGTISEEEKRREAAGTWEGAKREEKAVNHQIGQRKRGRKGWTTPASLLAVWSVLFSEPVLRTCSPNCLLSTSPLPVFYSHNNCLWSLLLFRKDSTSTILCLI